MLFDMKRQQQKKMLKATTNISVVTLVPEVLQLSVNTGKKCEQSFFYFAIYFLLLLSSNEGANRNSSVKFSCCFFVDFDLFQISVIFSVILFRASSCRGHRNRKCSVDSAISNADEQMQALSASISVSRY